MEIGLRDAKLIVETMITKMFDSSDPVTRSLANMMADRKIQTIKALRESARDLDIQTLEEQMKRMREYDPKIEEYATLRDKVDALKLARSKSTPL